MAVLNWKRLRSKGQALFEAELEAADEGNAALVELWAKVLDEVERGYSDSEWQALICYVEVETGRLLVYPVTPPRYEWADARVAVSLVHHGWRAQYDQFAALVETNEKRFEACYDKQFRALTALLKRAIDDGRVLPRFKQLKKRKTFAVYAVDGGESVHSANLKFLWGNRPAKPVPAGSARELFTFILRKAHLQPDYSMELDGDRVRKVNWFGGEFNDRYVNLLEQVPNLQQLCAGLEELSLTATRIKPAAVERLKNLLPDVAIKYISAQEWEQAELSDG